MFLNRFFLLTVTADFVDYIEIKHVKTFLVLHIIKNYNKEEQFIILFSVL